MASKNNYPRCRTDPIEVISFLTFVNCNYNVGIDTIPILANIR
jgi:hypothetical protein